MFENDGDTSSAQILYQYQYADCEELYDLSDPNTPTLVRTSCLSLENNIRTSLQYPRQVVKDFDVIKCDPGTTILSDAYNPNETFSLNPMQPPSNPGTNPNAFFRKDCRNTRNRQSGNNGTLALGALISFPVLAVSSVILIGLAGIGYLINLYRNENDNAENQEENRNPTNLYRNENNNAEYQKANHVRKRF